MLDWVHSNTTNIWPVSSLDLEFVMLVTSLQDWFFGSATGGDNTDHSTGVTVDGLTGTGWKDDSGSGTIFRVTDDGGAGAGGSGELTLVTSSLFDVHDDGTFWDDVDWEDVTDGDLGFLTAVNVLACVHTFSGDV